MGPDPAVAAVRLAVRRCLAEALEPGDLVLAACSGGADSLALAAALAFEAPKAGLRAGGIVVDHGLQTGSAELAATVVQTMTALGLDPAWSAAVSVAGPEGEGPYPGPEAAARAARYAALDRATGDAGAAAIMLGHTLDDQAETVLLGLARGSGARSLAGMPARSGRYLRPLLELRRADTRAACAALGLRAWDDPHNCDPAFARARVRAGLLPALEAALGPGVPEALARTARLLRADADALDALAAAEMESIRAADKEEGWPAGVLGALPAAIRRRILHAAALAAGCPAGALSERHVSQLEEFVICWHGQRWADLPGGVRCQRRYGRLLFTTAGSAGRPGASTARSEDPGGRE
ncbi:MAG TPA: tRNA lysidine(34) synthetase TilS [Streptosporangiaceae bacterium]|nr:tRNA lysidine(34) synthetase TilS [Streptosporangiaceae bacterium]